VQRFCRERERDRPNQGKVTSIRVVIGIYILLLLVSSRVNGLDTILELVSSQLVYFTPTAKLGMPAVESGLIIHSLNHVSWQVAAN